VIETRGVDMDDDHHSGIPQNLDYFDIIFPRIHHDITICHRFRWWEVVFTPQNPAPIQDFCFSSTFAASCIFTLIFSSDCNKLKISELGNPKIIPVRFLTNSGCKWKVRANTCNRSTSCCFCCSLQRFLIHGLLIGRPLGRRRPCQTKRHSLRGHWHCPRHAHGNRPQHVPMLLSTCKLLHHWEEFVLHFLDYFPLYWLVYRDPYIGLLKSPYNWVV